jgi:hypothetical protein
MTKRSIVLIGIVLAAALARLLPHPPNMTPIAAMALFGGACFRKRWVALLLPLAAMLLSDLALGYTTYGLWRLVRSQPIVYACILATTAIGECIKNRRSPWQVVAASLAGSILFFVVTNFAVWASGTMYPLTGTGLGTCYMMAIPFFGNTLAGDVGFTFVLFGGLAIMENRLGWMRETKKTEPVLA